MIKRMALQMGSVETKRPRRRSPAASPLPKPLLSGILASLSTPLNSIVERARTLSTTWKGKNDDMHSLRSQTPSGSLETLRSTLGELSAASRG